MATIVDSAALKESVHLVWIKYFYPFKTKSLFLIGPYNVKI